MRDTIWGILLITISIAAMAAYFWALFLSPPNITDPFIGKSISEWAILIPVLIFVYLFLIVIAWIGWAMATTPPTLPAPEENSAADNPGENGKIRKG